MLLGTAKEEVRARLQELTADFWTDNEVLRALNEGVNRFSQEEKWPWLYSVVTGVNLPANTPTLALQEGVAFERHFNLIITFAGDSRPRIPRRVGPAEGYQLRTRYYVSQAEPIAYYIVSQADADSDAEFVPTVRFVPPLSRAATVEYQYIRDPVEPTNDNQPLDIPNEYAMAAVAYATGHLFLKELSTSAKASEQFELYKKIVDDARKQVRKVVIDSGLAWGRNAPEYGFVEEVDWVEMVTPPMLG